MIRPNSVVVSDVIMPLIDVAINSSFPIEKRLKVILFPYVSAINTLNWTGYLSGTLQSLFPSISCRHGAVIRSEYLQPLIHARDVITIIIIVNNNNNNNNNNNSRISSREYT